MHGASFADREGSHRGNVDLLRAEDMREGRDDVVSVRPVDRDHERFTRHRFARRLFVVARDDGQAHLFEGDGLFDFRVERFVGEFLRLIHKVDTGKLFVQGRLGHFADIAAQTSDH